MARPGGQGRSLTGLAVQGRRAPGALFLEHTLGVSQVYAAISAALAGRDDIHLGDFRASHTFQGSGQHDVLPDPADGRRTIPIVPDGLFVLERADGRRRLAFLEVDRATMPLSRVAAKVRGYESYRLGVGPARFQARFSHPPDFTVMMVSSASAHLAALRRAVQAELLRWGWQARAGRYIFHLLPDLTPTTALAWTDVGGRVISLLGGGVPDSVK